ncbi:S9 family peptidase [Polaribacter sp. HaHaR_3_91]|uniref:alpha/beta hydrolase family protein n=1 Tax=Polaribacter sp. HaHaR_3_91 TaxID=2745561 RepID=UPI001C4E7C25|nr:alpha/beta hydrolase [Polaribacter sp. HaHaR_3_91]QXP62824.1 alpha/beta hydrolase [Polaribacter sp. HaHaR_3_91]
MIRFITYLIILTLGTLTSSAQLKTEEILIKNGEIELPGTLTFIEEKTPLIIWIHGSGPVDRNGNQPAQNVKANYIKQFRDSINKENIAFFSYDKRTANKNNSKLLAHTKITDFTLDAEKVITHFKNENRFSKIILVGHSQGSLIAMMAAKEVDQYISIAGSGEQIDETIIKQITKNNAPLGLAARKQFDTLRVKGKIETVHPFLMSIFGKPNQAFLYDWMQLNPKIEIKKLKIPVLIINGDKDLQVTIEDAKILHAANTNSKLVIIENMNHVLKDIQKEEDNIKSYYSSEYQISNKLIKTISLFIKK